MRVKKEKTEKITIDSERAYQFADTIILFIGVTMFLLPVLSTQSSIPQEFIFGSTLASFLLAFSDGLLINGKMGYLKFILYGLSFILGIVSLVFLPVIFSMHPSWFIVLEPFSNTLTILALGFVLIVIGFRSFNYKDKSSDHTRTKLLEISNRSENQDKELEALRNVIIKKNHDLDKNSDKIELEVKALLEETKSLLEENIKLKKELYELSKNSVHIIK